MPKYSVKKPFTILVAVILVLVLGFVSLMGIQTDLLPAMNLPYLLVITTYPGASPEQVETDVTQPLESALSTLNGVKNVTSQSNENYSLIYMEYQESTDMDSAMVKASTAVNQLGDTLPDMAGTPTLMEISPDMMATQYVAVDYDGMDIYALSDYVNETVLPQLERVDGVASISTTGLVEKTVEITLDQDKIDEVNDKLLVQVSDRLAEAKKELDANKAKINSGLKELDDAQAKLDAGKAQLNSQKADVTTQLRDAITELNKEILALEKKIADLQKDLDDANRKLEEAKNNTTTLPEVTLPIDDALFASCKQVIADSGAAYDPAMLPANLAEAQSDLAKMGAMISAIEAADAAIRATAQNEGLLEQNMTVEQTSAYLDAQYTAMVSRIQTLDVEIASLTDQKNAAEAAGNQEEVERLQQRIDDARSEQARCQSVIDANAARRARVNELNSSLTTLSTTKLALRNATVLLQARQQAESQLNNGLKPLQQALNETVQALNEQLTKAQELLSQLNDQRAKLQKMLGDLGNEAIDPAMADMAVQLLLSGSEAQLQLGEFQLSSGRTQLEAGKTQLEAAQEEYDSAREEALKNANLSQLLNMTTLQQLIYAQNFSMPAGYIEGGAGDNNRYIIKVGDAFSDADELKNMVLCNIDGIGDVRLADVANVEMTDNADDAYAKVDKNRAVLLSIYKSSTASTSTVSNASKAAMETLMAENEGLHLTTIMDQGDYIKLIVNSVLSNLVEGAALAIIVLALFLKDLRPTIVVAISMPLSVLFAIVLMYFTGITFNILSLSGLALGVGMLVDNSVVVIENIYRLRNRGIPAARASVQGARQVAGAIVSSTLTTICVFLPLVFTSGMVLELLSDMAWTITFSLLASLVVALTVVPCAGSTVLKKQKDIKHPWFDKILDGYEKLLRFCLRRKAVPLALAVVLLAASVWRVATMGIVMIPDMSSNQITVTVDVTNDTAKEDAFAAADSVMDAVMGIDGVETVGAMSGGSESMMMAGSSGTTDNTTFTYYVLLDTSAAPKAVAKEIDARTADMDCTVTVNTNGMMDMSALSGSGMQVDLYGNDLEDLRTAGKQVAALMESVDGIENVSDGQEASDAEVNISIDKDKAMRLGLTVAQVYQQIAAKLTTDTTATTLKAGGDSYTVKIVDKTDVPTLDDIFNMEFETSTTDDNGNTVKETHTLGEFATRTTTEGYTSISRENGSRMLSVTSETAEGYNTTLLSRELEPKLAELQLPDGVTAELAGETTQVTEMLGQMAQMLALALIFVYFVMVAQFQSLLSPFIVLFTIPLAFTGGMIGLTLAGEQLSLISLMGFLVLMGVVVNNGIVFVDYANQLRIGGLEREDALVATGRTRMRPILMTTLTTVLAMVTMLFGNDMASEMGTGMAIVIIGGLSYATLMTLFIVPVLYDLFYRKPPVNIDVGDDGMDDLPDDAAEFAAAFAARRAAEQDNAPAEEKRRPDLSRAAHAEEKPAEKPAEEPADEPKEEARNDS